MPELPEVEYARRRAEWGIVGKRIARVAAADDRIVFSGVKPVAFASALRDRRVVAVRRRGKHLWFELDKRPWPAFHFGMTGDFEIYLDERDRPRFWKVEFLMADGLRLAMTDARRLGRIRLQNDPEHQGPICELGFDPLLDRVSAETFAETLAKRKAAVKAVLLDQSLLAGVGNWIADEVFFQARINPHRRPCDLSGDELKRIHAALHRIVRKAVALDADSDRYPKAWLFNHRWGRNADATTAAGEKIIHETIAGRTAAWVPSIQR
jgi:formamidopyrimidine-DNA glycosylase